jgi:uridine kinase
MGETHTLCFDDYESATRKSAAEMDLWLSAGADFNALDAPGLADDLATLRGGGTMVNPITGNHQCCIRDVLFEMPLGRAWAATASSIDVLVWVDVPLDVALARRVGELALNLQQQHPAQAQAGLAWLQDYMVTYVKTIHSVLETQRRVVRPGADLVVNGLLPVAVNVQRVLQFLGSAA